MSCPESSLLVFFALALALEVQGFSLHFELSLELQCSSSLSLLMILLADLAAVFCGEHFAGKFFFTVFKGRSSSLEESEEHLLQDSELELLSDNFLFTSFAVFEASPLFFFTDGLEDFFGVTFRGIAAILSFKPVSQEVTENCGFRVLPCLLPEHSQSLAEVSLELEFYKNRKKNCLIFCTSHNIITLVL